jgi:hypothetical protein
VEEGGEDEEEEGSDSDETRLKKKMAKKEKFDAEIDGAKDRTGRDK